MMSEASTNDTSRGSPGQIIRGISTKSRGANMQKAVGAGGQSLHFKVHFLSGS
jgi:hypothetical protein